jgi:hypothetical protein
MDTIDTMRSSDVTFLGELLFPPADYRRTTLSTITWWESRRPTYNLIVGGTGLFTLVIVRLITLIPPGLPRMDLAGALVAYGLMANFCYTFGWAIELTLKRIMRGRAPMIGPALFRQGLAFSVGLTLLPIVIASIGWVARTGMWLVGR